MKNKVFLLIAIILSSSDNLFAQTGNNVFTGAEAASFGIVNLATPGGQTWSSFRGAAPGYFSAVNTATYTGASDAANVNGYIKKYGNQAFTFVVGTGADLRTLSISAPAASTDAYATAWIAGDPSGATDPTTPNAGAHSIVSPVGQWDWQVGNAGNLGAGTTGTGTGLTITVSIPDMSTFSLAIDLRLVGWNGASWIDLSGAATASGNLENSTLSGTMIAGITAIGIGSTVDILPLSLLNFTAAEQDCAVALSWETTNEVNTQRFDIQQSSDGVVFKTIGNKAAPSTLTGSHHHYDFNARQSQGNAWYRLKMINIDGSSTYSSVIGAHISCYDKSYFTLYPSFIERGNSGLVKLNFSLAYKGNAFIVVTNTIGQVLERTPIVINEGVNVISLNTTALQAAGTYFVQLTNLQGGRIADVKKIIKQ
jgi:hypothetical protein